MCMHARHLFICISPSPLILIPIQSFNPISSSSSSPIPSEFPSQHLSCFSKANLPYINYHQTHTKAAPFHADHTYIHSFPTHPTQKANEQVSRLFHHRYMCRSKPKPIHPSIIISPFPSHPIPSQSNMYQKK
jgi:hypothetical protein